MQVLVLTADPSLVSALTDVSREFGIEAQFTDFLSRLWSN